MRGEASHALESHTHRSTQRPRPKRVSMQWGSLLPWSVNTHTQIHTHRYRDTHRHRHTHARRHTDTHRHTQTHTHTHTRTHKHTHTHTVDDLTSLLTRLFRHCDFWLTSRQVAHGCNRAFVGRPARSGLLQVCGSWSVFERWTRVIVSALLCSVWHARVISSSPILCSIGDGCLLGLAAASLPSVHRVFTCEELPMTRQALVDIARSNGLEHKCGLVQRWVAVVSDEISRVCVFGFHASAHPFHTD
jgi:hypothetical protein